MALSHHSNVLIILKEVSLMKNLKLTAITSILVIVAIAVFSRSYAQTLVPFYIIIGQSNTGWATTNGMNTQQAALYAGVQSNTSIWNPGVGGFSATWQTMNVGVNTRCENYADPSQFGPEASLMKSLESRQSRKRFVYKQGVGGTTLAVDWRPQSPGQQPYEAGIRWQQLSSWLPTAVAQADAQGVKLDLKAIIWMQGEDDAKTAADASAYQNNLVNFFTNIDAMWRGLISRHGLPSTVYKKVIGRIYAPTGYPYRDMVRAAQANYCANSSNNAILINTDSYPLQDWVHYNATGQIQFGTDVYNAHQYETGAPVASTGVYFTGKVFLQGAYSPSSGRMSTLLNSSGVLQNYASSQPYNNSTFNYSGTERVSGGFFAAHTDIVDWVLVELRNSSSPSTVVARRAGLLRSDGLIVDTDGSTTRILFAGVPSGGYYVVVKHRNHLSIRSSQVIDFNSGSGHFDFTTSGYNCYQNMGYFSSVHMGNAWTMRGGNANMNNNVKYNGPLNDQDRIQNGALGGSLTGVVSSVYSYDDINLDASIKTNGPNNDQNFLLNLVFGGLIGTVYMEQL
ncbi:hypothetical protein EXU57_23505 [Segetibacter sp. 3557_3]|nr:sialate O-acetylesterase [Segetibacter sp. 3557_3]TDH18327.1 hypothetical protein EXU57_23505 [Segetibacter sp. 3557_3]